MPTRLLRRALTPVAAETLKIASPKRGSWESAISHLGKQAGIFRKHGLDLEILYTAGGGETLQVVISGAVDIGLSAGTLGVLGAYSKGAPVRIIGASSTGSRELFWYAPEKSPLQTIRDVNENTHRLFDHRRVLSRRRAAFHQRVRLEGQAGRDRRRLRRPSPR